MLTLPACMLLPHASFKGSQAERRNVLVIIIDRVKIYDDDKDDTLHNVNGAKVLDVRECEEKFTQKMMFTSIIVRNRLSKEKIAISSNYKVPLTMLVSYSQTTKEIIHNTTLISL
ncbi:hypothetical protein evm_001211 [Chilo suppressalis]|nr:hypothetical protein evm_001211 [Chilo suppressalis]